MANGKLVGLFAGIGGLEVGLHPYGWGTELFCEIDPGAQAVLRTRFPDVPVWDDVGDLDALPEATDMVTAGFPCQDLSQAGRTAGIGGSKSGLVEHVFRLVDPEPGPRWLLIENVPFMLQLDRGRAMRHLTAELEDLGYDWAYRVVDARAFGRPQRRWRVLMLASRTEDPREVLFGQDAGEPPAADPDEHGCGFYWTEGTRGLGWAVDAVPTLKGGSTVGIASPPAVRLTGGRGLVTPGITDAEWLQGFDRDWTRPALDAGLRPGHRWRLVGNAVSALMSDWIGHRLTHPEPYDGRNDQPLQPGDPWPTAAWGRDRVAHRVDTSMWPIRAHDYVHIQDALDEPRELSARATAGFLRRARSSKLRFVDGFLDDVAAHLEHMGGDPARVG